ncbi:cation transporter [Anaerococcus tetradius]|jgi:hypothetical protein|uniref:Heavy metal-associated domain protein n=1 Tax=Anaerococcus tetradius TaxID=33036 RepID=A0A133KAA6_9FIRM|nr:cation transporter [Anaerococcus tetradius]KWZ76491.1 heavy metal-associated domain protein [Anaerococcus tetradius]
MKMKLKIQGLNCANCGNKIENEIKKIEGVIDASLSFLTEKAKIEIADDNMANEILAKVNEIADRIEPGCKLILK